MSEEGCVFLGEHSGGVQMWIRPAAYEQDHEAIERVALESATCAPFAKRKTYSGPEAYEEGRVRVLVDVHEDGTQRCVGFTCAKLKESGELALYFLAVAKPVRRKGCGRELVDDLRETHHPHWISSTLPSSAEDGLAFASAVGFTVNGRTARGGIRLRLDEW